MKDKGDMEYIKSQNRREYIREVMSVSAQMGAVSKDPGKNIKDYRIMLIIIIVALILTEIGIASVAIMSKDILSAIVSGVILLLLVLYALRLGAYDKTFFMLLKNNEDRRLELDKEGVARTGSDQEVKVRWDGIRCIRVYKYSVLFLGKDVNTTPILAPVENLEGIESFLKENDIQIEIIRGK